MGFRRVSEDEPTTVGKYSAGSKGRVRKVFIGFGIFMALLLGGVTAAWAIDSRAHDDAVMRNVTLNGVNVGGMTRAELKEEVARLAAAEHQNKTITIKTADTTVTT